MLDVIRGLNAGEVLLAAGVAVIVAAYFMTRAARVQLQSLAAQDDPYALFVGMAGSIHAAGERMARAKVRDEESIDATGHPPWQP
jgi:D-serine deaminase-like pyridoxal phosphate-dependent protein